MFDQGSSILEGITGSIIIADLLPWSDLEKSMYTTLF